MRSTGSFIAQRLSNLTMATATKEDTALISTATVVAATASLAAIATGAGAMMSLVKKNDTVARYWLDHDKLHQLRLNRYRETWSRAVLNTVSSKKEKIVLIKEETEMKKFLEKHVVRKDGGALQLSIVGIEQDLVDSEIYIYLTTTPNAESTIYQFPFKSFGLLLGEAIEARQAISTTTVCFVGDASSGLGTEIIESIFGENHEDKDLQLLRVVCTA